MAKNMVMVWTFESWLKLYFIIGL